MIDRDEPVRECFAFNKDGLRCTGRAGHPGKHGHAIEWGDDECWTPTAGLPIPQPPIWPPVQPAPQGSGMCAICEHPMHDGRCGADDGGFECDCAQGIED
jgi:hypothetical protein